jgi:hypothetical protein
MIIHECSAKVWLSNSCHCTAKGRHPPPFHKSDSTWALMTCPGLLQSAVLQRALLDPDFQRKHSWERSCPTAMVLHVQGAKVGLAATCRPAQYLKLGGPTDLCLHLNACQFTKACVLVAHCVSCFTD